MHVHIDAGTVSEVVSTLSNAARANQGRHFSNPRRTRSVQATQQETSKTRSSHRPRKAKLCRMQRQCSITLAARHLAGDCPLTESSVPALVPLQLSGCWQCTPSGRSRLMCCRDSVSDELELEQSGVHISGSGFTYIIGDYSFSFLCSVRINYTLKQFEA